MFVSSFINRSNQVNIESAGNNQTEIDQAANQIETTTIV
jgi:hypothetical protein